jgi:hypothetical protein
MPVAQQAGGRGSRYGGGGAVLMTDPEIFDQWRLELPGLRHLERLADREVTLI